MRLCDELRIEAGFFSSRCLAQIAPGLAAFVNDTKGILQLMASPEISEEDQEAIRRGVSDPQTVLQQAMDKLFESARLSESAIERHAVETLSFPCGQRTTGNARSSDGSRDVPQEDMAIPVRRPVAGRPWLRERDRTRATGERRADVHRPSVDGWTALSRACRNVPRSVV